MSNEQKNNVQEEALNRTVEHTPTSPAGNEVFRDDTKNFTGSRKVSGEHFAGSRKKQDEVFSGSRKNPGEGSQQREASDDTPESEVRQADPTEGVGSTDTPEEADSFPRAYVEKLRKENADHRAKAKDRDDLAQRLHTTLVQASGRLQDPSDLPYSEDHLQDPEALERSIEDLLARKPHLAARTPRGNIGQGATQGDNPVSLSSILRMGV